VKIAAAICLFFAVAAAGVLVFIYSGVYDIGAMTPHFDLTSRVLRTAMEQSVKRQSRYIKVPELDDPEKVHMGFKKLPRDVRHLPWRAGHTGIADRQGPLPGGSQSGGSG